MSLTTVRIGFLPLVDSAVLVAAQAFGFAEAQGLRLELSREASWANIRDKLVYRHFDTAHMLAGLPIAATLGLSRAPTPVIAPFCLGLNGNAVTLATDIAADLAAQSGHAIDFDDAGGMALALAELVAARRARGLAPLRLGVPHRFSSHNYMLRYWLAFAGIDPERDVQLVIVPPPLTVDALRAGEIDGFCVGEPWSSIAVAAGVGHIVALGCRIWQRGVEKVLGMRGDWAEANPETLAALLRALDRAARWAGDAANRPALAAMMARPELLDRPAALIARVLSGRLLVAPDREIDVPDFLMLYSDAANFPWVSQAQWIYSQMLRWGQVAPGAAAEAAVRGVFRPDLYRRALGGTDTPMPGANAKVEGALAAPLAVGSPQGRLSIGPDGFFDGRRFDPDQLGAYLAGFDAG
ncbi:MAG: ABC transporter substrate-binding protein [Sandarakinorhabdus sp.]|nr:ABC transporter substrate-binding protein [Sandarakinorhabdus sp.]